METAISDQTAGKNGGTQCRNSENDEARMSNDEGMPELKTPTYAIRVFVIRH
jgi:hypothetical protein